MQISTILYILVLVMMFIAVLFDRYMYYKHKKACKNHPDLIKKLQKEGIITNNDSDLTWEDIYSIK